MMTPAKPKKPRRVPPSVKVYLPDAKRIEDLEKHAAKYNCSVSQLCLWALDIGLPVVYRNMEEIVPKSV